MTSVTDPSSSRQRTTSDEPPQRREIVSTILYAPPRLLFILLYRAAAFLQPYASQIIPIFICLLLVPLVISLSLYAGWLVWRSVPVAWQVPIDFQYGDGASPYSQATIAGIAPYQPYDISLRLSVPATEANFGLGNFMAALELTTPSNKSIASVRRSAIILPSSSTTLFIFSTPRKLIDLKISLLDSFSFGTSKAMARVEVGRRDLWKTLGRGEGRELSVYSASLVGRVRHSGVTGLVSRFPLVSAVVASTIFLFVCLLVVTSCILPTVFTNNGEYTPHELPPMKPDLDPNSGGDEEPPKPRRRSRGARSSMRRVAVKREGFEEDVQLVPSSSGQRTSSPPLRRRRSRVEGGLSDSDV
ncbi:hypothetical protein BDN71DRAFT_1438204 [Pleurotus eryngii]|uniref:Adipose-regulatory protein-domain-containing protein n=1 Tax=Pleurotus eryngii TaxID=5323 RepID=A0A9P6A9R1_PLEER|nr:hypothetical protein BDN71DRAFT_1438204 [Pleurotus eryngii]